MMGQSCPKGARMPGTTCVNVPARKVRFGNAADAGYAAGRSVQLAYGVTGGRPVKQIGGRHV